MNISILFITILFLNANFLFADEVSQYMHAYRSTGQTNYQVEQQIFGSNNLIRLTDKLNPYYTDSLPSIRMKAFYLTYKKRISDPSASAETAANILLKGCGDNNSALIIGQNILYLQEFQKNDFDEAAKVQIDLLLARRNFPHFKKLVMLAGYAGTGGDILKQQILQPETSSEKKWTLSLGLARLGDAESTRYCIELVKKMPVTNQLMFFVIPELIFTRQKSSIDYIIELLNDDNPLCSSPDPDKSERILCGYYIMEQLAPVIKDFPYAEGPGGGLDTDDYEKALIVVREFFSDNPDYSIDSSKF